MNKIFKFPFCSIIAITLIGTISCRKQERLPISETIVAKNIKDGAQVSATTTYNVTPSTDLGTSFWDTVQGSLASGPVIVVFASGTYTRTAAINLTGRGHATNLLTLKGASSTSGAITITSAGSGLLFLISSQNIRLQYLTFTGGATGNAVTVRESENIKIENCRFVELPDVQFAALSVNTDTDNVLVKACIFTRIGYATGSHMIYGAYHVTRLKIIGNQFTDCAGSFVRFRGDITSQGVVYDNNFISTGTYLGGKNPVFIEVPVINDVNPGDERFGTRFMITKNIFNYSTSGSQWQRYALAFTSQGYNPLERTHLISAADAATLGSGTVSEKRAIMSNQLGLNGTEIRFGGNTNYNVEYNVVYRCYNGYGSNGPWEGVKNIGTAVTTAGLATTTAEAEAYYDDLH